MSSDIWDRFEAMLQANAPALLATLNPPASEERIAEAEVEMAVIFPEEIRAAYLRHDGTSHAGQIGASCLLFYPMNWWANLEEVVDNWQMKVRVSESLRNDDSRGYFPTYNPWWDDLKVCPVWWNPKWVPIGLSGTATSVYVDLEPAPKGTIGQLIADDGMQEASVIASGLNHYLEMLIDRVERKVLVFGEGWELADPNQSVYGAHGFDWNQLP